MPCVTSYSGGVVVVVDIVFGVLIESTALSSSTVPGDTHNSISRQKSLNAERATPPFPGSTDSFCTARACTSTVFIIYSPDKCFRPFRSACCLLHWHMRIIFPESLCAQFHMCATINPERYSLTKPHTHTRGSRAHTRMHTKSSFNA